MTPPMGFVATPEAACWRDVLADFYPNIVDATFGREPLTHDVVAWIIVAPLTVPVRSYRWVLPYYTRPIFLITPHMAAVRRHQHRLVKLVPVLTIICHPTLAAGHLEDFHLLANARTGGMWMFDVPCSANRLRNRSHRLH